MATNGWKFWVRRYGQPLCFIVGREDRDQAERLLRSCEPFAEVLDAERVPEKICTLLEMKPNQVTGWSVMPKDDHLHNSPMTIDDLDPVGAAERRQHQE